MDILFKFAFWFLFYVSFHWKAAAASLLQMCEKFFFLERFEWFSCLLVWHCSQSLNGVPLLWVASVATNRIQCCLISDILKTSQFNWKRLVPLNPYNCIYSLYVFIIYSSMTGDCVCVHWSAFDDGCHGIPFFAQFVTNSRSHNCPWNTYAQRSASKNRRRRRNCQWESTVSSSSSLNINQMRLTWKRPEKWLAVLWRCVVRRRHWHGLWHFTIYDKKMLRKWSHE